MFKALGVLVGLYTLHAALTALGGHHAPRRKAEQPGDRGEDKEGPAPCAQLGKDAANRWSDQRGDAPDT